MVDPLDAAALAEEALKASDDPYFNIADAYDYVKHLARALLAERQARLEAERQLVEAHAAVDMALWAQGERPWPGIEGEKSAAQYWLKRHASRSRVCHMKSEPYDTNAKCPTCGLDVVATRRVIEAAEAWYYADEPLDKLAVALDALAALPRVGTEGRMSP